MAANSPVIAQPPVATTPSVAGTWHLLARSSLGWIVPLAIFLLWSVAAQLQWMPQQILPSPLLVWRAAAELAAEDLFLHLWISLQRLSIGLAAGTLAGVLLGVVMGYSRIAKLTLYPTFFALIQIPTLAWLPLFMIVFGIGETLKLAVILKAVIVPVAIHTMAGVQDTQPKLREVARVLRLPTGSLFRTLIVPTTLPPFLTGMRLALAQAWISLLAVELLASSEGIGYLMVWGRQLFMLDIVFVCIVVIALVGMLMDRGIRFVDRRLVRWPQQAVAELTLPRVTGLARALPWVLPAVLLIAWQWASASQVVDPNLLPAPTTVVSALVQGVKDGSLVHAMLETLGRSLVGLLVGGGIGVIVGVRVGLSSKAERILGPTLATLRQVAVFAWVPLITAWFGIGEGAKLAFVSLAAFFPMFVAAHDGVANLSAQLHEVAQALRFPAGLRLRVLILPGAASALFAGAQLGLTYSWLGAIGSEYFMRSGAGIGSLMINAQQLARMDVVIGSMLLVGLAGALLRIAGEKIEKHATRWRTSSLPR